MDRLTNNRLAQNYINEINASIRQPIVEKTLGPAPIDRSKAFFMILPRLNNELWREDINTAAIAVGAIHAAFDMHDEIHFVDASSKQQQLKVLTGDYFSGIHYRLLASLPDYGLIRSMADRIGLINETKTNLLRLPLLDMNQLIESVKIIEAGCISEFYRHGHFEEYTDIAETALTLDCFENKMSKELFKRIEWEQRIPNSLEFDRVISLLTDKLTAAVEAAAFLHPNLRREILHRSRTLSEKPI